MEAKNLKSGSAFESLFERVEKLTKVQRIAIFCVTIALAIGAFTYFSFLPKREQIDKLKNKFSALKKQLNTAQKKAAQYDEWQAKMKKAEADFNMARKELPEKKEIPSLLTSISESGQDVGLEFLLFEPKNEKRQDFYAEIPVAMNVLSDYHNLASFFDNVARLPRIVNIQNIAMSRGKDGQDLTTSCTAVTYRFVDEPPQKKTDNKSKKKKKKKSRKNKKK